MEIERRRNQINELKNHYNSNYKTFVESMKEKRPSLKGTFSNNEQVLEIPKLMGWFSLFIINVSFLKIGGKNNRI